MDVQRVRACRVRLRGCREGVRLPFSSPDLPPVRKGPLRWPFASTSRPVNGVRIRAYKGNPSRLSSGKFDIDRTRIFHAGLNGPGVDGRGCSCVRRIGRSRGIPAGGLREGRLPPPFLFVDRPVRTCREPVEGAGGIRVVGRGAEARGDSIAAVRIRIRAFDLCVQTGGDGFGRPIGSGTPTPRRGCVNGRDSRRFGMAGRQTRPGPVRSGAARFDRRRGGRIPPTGRIPEAYRFPIRAAG